MTYTAIIVKNNQKGKLFQMMINARLLIMLISERFDVTEYGRELKTEELSLPIFYERGMKIKNGQICIARTQELPVSTDVECLFICCGSRPTHNWNHRLGKLLFIDQRNLDILTLFNAVQDICDTITNWMLKMHTLTAENASIEKFVSASIPVFENCITITDYNLRVLVNCEMAEVSGQKKIIIDHQFDRIPDGVIPSFQNDFTRNIMRREPFLYKGQRENPQGENYCINLYHGDNYIGTCTLWEKLRPFRESDFVLFQKFASFIRRILSSSVREPDIVSIKTVFSDLLQCFPVSSSALNNAMSMVQMNMDSQKVSFGSWYCVVIRSANREKTLPEQYLCTALENLLPRCSALFFDQLLVCCCMVAKGENFEDTIYGTLKSYLKDMNFKAGISYPFTDFYDARYYYLQARAMLETGGSTLPDQFIYTCQDCILSYMMRHCTGEFPPDLMLPPGLKNLLAKENGIDYWYTLKKYLDNECNASRTAQELYLHRTSLQSRLDKIKSHVSLDTPEERLYLRICINLYDSVIKKTQKETMQNT